MELILVRGLPGTGKSTLGRSMSDTHVHCETDEFFMKGEVYGFDGTRLKEAHQQCYNKAKAALYAGKNAVVTNTFVKLEDMREYLQLADEYGAEFKVIECKEFYGTTHGCWCFYF